MSDNLQAHVPLITVTICMCMAMFVFFKELKRTKALLTHALDTMHQQQCEQQQRYQQRQRHRGHQGHQGHQQCEPPTVSFAQVVDVQSHVPSPMDQPLDHDGQPEPVVTIPADDSTAIGHVEEVTDEPVASKSKRSVTADPDISPPDVEEVVEEVASRPTRRRKRASSSCV
jgi:hypothetical protein